jgi:hypothetical protein
MWVWAKTKAAINRMDPPVNPNTSHGVDAFLPKLDFKIERFITRDNSMQKVVRSIKIYPRISREGR